MGERQQRVSGTAIYKVAACLIFYGGGGQRIRL